MSAKFFVLYGNKTVTAHVTDEAELFEWVRRDGVAFAPEIYANRVDAIEAAERVLDERYTTWGTFEYTPAGMAEFLESAAAQADELIGLHALELAQEYVEEAQKRIAIALTGAQQKAISRVKWPIAGDKIGFQEYQENIANIRDLSIKSLYEYVENGDETPE